MQITQGGGPRIVDFGLVFFTKTNRLLYLGLPINIYTPIRIASSRQLLLILHLWNKHLVPRELPI